MRNKQHIAVIDIGKSNAKLALVDLESLAEIAVLTQPNKVLPAPPWPHFDLEGHWDFLLHSLSELHQRHRIDAISITTHGASAVLLDQNGNLAAPMLDYEHDGPNDIAKDYDAVRPDFLETGSPRLASGLNLGAQLYWMFEQDQALKDRVAFILTYPQYWGYRLTGVAACDVSSLGCHTDLWDPYKKGFSTLVDKMGLADKFAPARPANECLGPILPDLARQTGLSADIPVYVGIHDSNASLFPHLLTGKPPFSVVSTGTWVIAMAIGGEKLALDPDKDTLINVSALGDPVPSARFMGGREFELASKGAGQPPLEADLQTVLETGLMLLPSLQGDVGPFKGRKALWLPEEPPVGTGIRTATISLYLAMVTSCCLEMIGHKGQVIVEGPFTRNEVFLDMLSAATRSPVITAGSATGTSQGAALLVSSENPPLDLKVPRPPKPELKAYAALWRRALDQSWPNTKGHYCPGKSKAS